MRILVVTSDVPFVEGGHRIIARALVRALRDEGHDAELWTTPQNRFGRQVPAYLATWLTDVEIAGDGQPIERLISLRFPSYAVRHRHHVVWLNHRMREYYDLWDGFRSGLGVRGRLVEGARRRTLHLLDAYLLRRCRKVFAQSRTIRERLQRWGKVPCEVLYPPPPPRPYRCERHDGPILAVGRLTPLKRFDLLLDAVATVPGLRLRIAGHGPQRAELVDKIGSLGIADRVEMLAELDDEALVAEYAACSAVWFGPRAEDYGMVTLEAFASSKAVVTCTDSGGPAELVEDSATGFVVAPEPGAIGAALERLAGDVGTATRMGEAAREVAARHTWPATVARLLEA